MPNNDVAIAVESLPENLAPKVGEKALDIHKENDAIVGVKIAMPHGGAVWRGKAPNHKPGPGRPPKDIRRKMRWLLDKRCLPALRKYLEENYNDIPPDLLLKMVDRLSAHGMPTQLEVSGPDGGVVPMGVVVLPARDVQDYAGAQPDTDQDED